jgi:4-amino-4-deoxy-L-arabinose transferase-like glycosyltransferase
VNPTPPRGPFARLTDRPWLTLWVALLLALHAGVALHSVTEQGWTHDEVAHLTAGHVYWTHGDFRFQPENGNLPQRWAALGTLPLSPSFRTEEMGDVWPRAHVWRAAHRFLFQSGNPAELMLFSGRAAMVFWGVAGGLLVFFAARATWGARPALLSLALYGFSPTVLANAPLITSDMCAAVLLPAAAWAWWRACHRVTPGTLALAGLATGLACVAKFSAVLLGPVFVALAVLRLVAPNGKPRLRRLRELALAGVVTACLALGVIWLFFGFRHSAFSPDLPGPHRFFFTWEQMLEDSPFWDSVLRKVAAIGVFPEAFLHGFVHVRYQSLARSAFLMGSYSLEGWWWFFPFTWLVKSTLGELLAAGLTATGFFAVIRRAGPNAVVHKLISPSPFAPLVVFAAVYGGFAILGNLNIGHRHILPLYLVSAFLAAGAVNALAGSWGRRLLPVTLALSALEALVGHPYHLAFFNRAAGGPENGWRLLVDSSLDWGQELPRTAEWIATNRLAGEPVHLAYFGSDDPRYHGISATRFSELVMLERALEYAPLSGGIYAVSATLLQEVYSQTRGSWDKAHEADFQRLKATLGEDIEEGTVSRSYVRFRSETDERIALLENLRFGRLAVYLRRKEPEAVIGRAVRIYRLSDHEVKVLTEGSPVDYADLLESLPVREGT